MNDDDLENFIKTAAQGRETDCIELFKSPTKGLGFSVIGLRSEHRGDLGIFIQVNAMCAKKIIAFKKNLHLGCQTRWCC